MSRPAVIVACFIVALVVAVAGGGAYMLRRQHDAEVALAAERQKEAALQLAAQKRAANDVLVNLQEKQSVEAAYTATITKEGVAFTNDQDDATKVSKERHDRTLAGTMTLPDALDYSDQEQSDVLKMRTDAQALADTSNSIAALFEKQYGADAVRAYRNDIGELLTQRQLYLNNWDRAIGDIIDIYKQQQNGQQPNSTSNAETFYQQSNDDWTRSLSIMRRTFDDKTTLEKRLSGDIANAKKHSAELAAQAPAK